MARSATNERSLAPVVALAFTQSSGAELRAGAAVVTVA